MALTAFKRIIKNGFLNFKRSGLISWAAVLVVTITLSVITSIILLQAVLHFSLTQIKDKVDVTIYFTVGAPEDKIILLKSYRKWRKCLIPAQTRR
jgi:cell division protein FtsX